MKKKLFFALLAVFGVDKIVAASSKTQETVPLATPTEKAEAFDLLKNSGLSKNGVWVAVAEFGTEYAKVQNIIHRLYYEFPRKDLTKVTPKGKTALSEYSFPKVPTKSSVKRVLRKLKLKSDAMWKDVWTAISATSKDAHFYNEVQTVIHAAYVHGPDKSGPMDIF